MHDVADGVLPVPSENTASPASLKAKAPAKIRGTWSAIVADKLEEKEEREEDRRRKLSGDVHGQTPNK